MQSRYYDPELGRFINADDVSYLEPESINGLNLYAYCGSNPVMNVDPEGTSWWKRFWKAVGTVIVAVAVVAIVTVAVAATAGTIVAALGAGTALVSAVTTGAVVGGLVAGGVSIVGQGVSKGFDNINVGTVIVDTFQGSAYGAISSIAGSGAGLATKIGVGLGKVALSATATALHSLNETGSVNWGKVAKSAAFSLALQTVFIGGSYLKFGGGSGSGNISKIMDSKAGQFSKAVVTKIMSNPHMKIATILGFSGLWNMMSGKYR